MMKLIQIAVFGLGTWWVYTGMKDDPDISNAVGSSLLGGFIILLAFATASIWLQIFARWCWQCFNGSRGAAYVSKARLRAS